MSFQQEKRNSVIRQDNVRVSQNFQSPQKLQEVQTNDRHTGCIEKMRVLTQELDRMTDALKLKQQEAQQLYQELQYSRQNQSQDQNNIEYQIQVERQKLEQYKQMKEQQLADLENELNIVHKELKDERLQKLDYVNRYEKQCGEVVRLQKELEKSNNQQVSNQEIEQLHHHLEDLSQENDDLKKQNNSLQVKVQQQLQQIALLEDQLTQQQQQQAPQQQPSSYQLPQTQYKQPGTSSYSKVTTYTVESKGTNKPTEVKQQVVKTINGKTDVYEYSSNDPNGVNPRESFTQRANQLINQVNNQPTNFSNTYEIRNSQAQNSVTASQLQRGSKYIPETYKKEYTDYKSKIETKPVTEYKSTVTVTNNRNSKQY